MIEMKLIILLAIVVLSGVNGAVLAQRYPWFTRSSWAFQYSESTEQTEQPIVEKLILQTEPTKSEDYVKTETSMLGESYQTYQIETEDITTRRTSMIGERTTEHEWIYENNLTETENHTRETSMSTTDSEFVYQTEKIESEYSFTTESIMFEDDVSTTEINRIAQNYKECRDQIIPANAIVAGNNSDIEWISTTPEQAITLAEQAVVGGYEGHDGSPLWVIRARYEGDLIPGKLPIKHQVAYVPRAGNENYVQDIEVLCTRRPENLKWMKSMSGAIPASAIIGGFTAAGEPLYIGRAKEQGSLTPGKVQPSQKAMYISFYHKEIKHTFYEILCYENNVIIKNTSADDSNTNIEWNSQTEEAETEIYYTSESTTPEQTSQTEQAETKIYYTSESTTPEQIMLDFEQTSQTEPTYSKEYSTLGNVMTYDRNADIEWVPTTPEEAFSLADRAVVGGYEGHDGSPLWVIRAKYQGDLIPGKLPIKYEVAYVPWGGKENSVQNIEVLCTRKPTKLQWEVSRNGQVPANAIIGGSTASGEPLYIGRAREQGSLTPGKVHPKLETMYISFYHQEIKHAVYEVLCYNNNTEPEKLSSAENMTDIGWTSQTEQAETESYETTENKKSYDITIDSVWNSRSEPIEIELNGSVENVTNDDIKWILTTPEQAFTLADWAVVGGYDNFSRSPLWIIRAVYGRDLIPGKLLIEHQVAFVPWGGKEYSVHEIEVLCSRKPTKLQWKSSNNGIIPNNAIVGGMSSTDEHLFIGRAVEKGSLIPGKVHPSLETMYVSYLQKEIKHTAYDVLCYENYLEPENEESTTDIEWTSHEAAKWLDSDYLTTKNSIPGVSSSTASESINQIKQKQINDIVNAMLEFDDATTDIEWTFTTAPERLDSNDFVKTGSSMPGEISTTESIYQKVPQEIMDLFEKEDATTDIDWTSLTAPERLDSKDYTTTESSVPGESSTTVANQSIYPTKRNETKDYITLKNDLFDDSTIDYLDENYYSDYEDFYRRYVRNY